MWRLRRWWDDLKEGVLYDWNEWRTERRMIYEYRFQRDLAKAEWWKGEARRDMEDDRYHDDIEYRRACDKAHRLL